ncbi:MAG: phasin family protein [Betaproteobacteria bacterium]|jgi:phasin family protein
MTTTTQDFTAPVRAQIESTIRAATIASESAARLFELTSQTARATFDELAGTVQAVASAKDPADLRNVATKAFKPDFEKSQAYARSVFEQITATQSQLVSLVESQVTEFNKQMVVAMDSLMKGAPSGSEPFVSAFKSAVSSANQAYEATVQSLQEMGSSIISTAPAGTATGSKRKSA